MRKRTIIAISDQIAFKSRIDIDRCHIIVNALEKAKLQEENRELLEELLIDLLTQDLDLSEIIN
jgi:hypothetical protein